LKLKLNFLSQVFNTDFSNTKAAKFE